MPNGIEPRTEVSGLWTGADNDQSSGSLTRVRGSRGTGRRAGWGGTVWVVNEDDLLSAVVDWPELGNRLAELVRTQWAGAVGSLV